MRSRVCFQGTGASQSAEISTALQNDGTRHKSINATEAQTAPTTKAVESKLGIVASQPVCSLELTCLGRRRAFWAIQSSQIDLSSSRHHHGIGLAAAFSYKSVGEQKPYCARKVRTDQSAAEACIYSQTKNSFESNEFEHVEAMERPAAMPLNRTHVPDVKLIEGQFPEPVMPACPINKVLKGQKAIVTGGSSGRARGTDQHSWSGTSSGKEAQIDWIRDLAAEQKLRPSGPITRSRH
jgi:hypothetical protein